MSTKYQAVFDAYKTEFKRVNGSEVIKLEEITGSRGWCLLQTDGGMPASKVHVKTLEAAVERFKERPNFTPRDEGEEINRTYRWHYDQYVSAMNAVHAHYMPRIKALLAEKKVDAAMELTQKIPCPVTRSFALDLIREFKKNA